MTFDHDFGYYFPLFSSLLKKREKEKENGLCFIPEGMVACFILLIISKSVELKKIIKYLNCMHTFKHGIKIVNQNINQEIEMVTQFSIKCFLDQA